MYLWRSNTLNSTFSSIILFYSKFLHYFYNCKSILDSHQGIYLTVWNISNSLYQLILDCEGFHNNICWAAQTIEICFLTVLETKIQKFRCQCNTRVEVESFPASSRFCSWMAILDFPGIVPASLQSLPLSSYAFLCVCVWGQISWFYEDTSQTKLRAHSIFSMTCAIMIYSRKYIFGVWSLLWQSYRDPWNSPC